MTKPGRLDELKLRSEIFCKKSAEAVQILNDRHWWYEFPVEHPTHLRQFIYWLNFKKPAAWKVMNLWLQMYDLSMQTLAQLVKNARKSVQGLKNVDGSKIMALQRIVDTFLDPGVDFKTVAKFYRENLETLSLEKNATTRQLLRMTRFADTHSKISFYADPRRVIPITNILKSNFSSKNYPAFDTATESFDRNVNLPNVSHSIVSWPFNVSIEDSMKYEGILKFGFCVIYLCEEVQMHVNNVVKESEFRSVGLLRRIEAYKQYQNEKIMRSGMYADKQVEDAEKVPKPEIDWESPVISTKKVF